MHLLDSKMMIWPEELFTTSPSLEMEGFSFQVPTCCFHYLGKVADSPDGVDMLQAQCQSTDIQGLSRQ